MPAARAVTMGWHGLRPQRHIHCLQNLLMLNTLSRAGIFIAFETQTEGSAKASIRQVVAGSAGADNNACRVWIILSTIQQGYR